MIKVRAQFLLTLKELERLIKQGQVGLHAIVTVRLEEWYKDGSGEFMSHTVRRTTTVGRAIWRKFYQKVWILN